jgi:hypothetical protein
MANEAVGKANTDISDKDLIKDVADSLKVPVKDLAIEWSGKSRVVRYYGQGHEGSKVAMYNAKSKKLEVYGIKESVDESINQY